MTQTTIPVKGEDAVTYQVPVPNSNGQAAMAGSAPVVPAADWIPNAAPGVALDGTDATGVTAPAGGVGMRGWLSGIYKLLSNPLGVTGTFFQATQPVSVTALPLPNGAAADGTDATGLVQLAGGVGLRGWLSGIFARLSNPLAVTGSFFQATQPVSLVSLPLAPGSALDSSVQQVLSAIKATVNLTGTIWYDPTVNPVVYYVRRESVNEGTGVVTVSWWTPGGVGAAPTIANLVAMSDSENVKSQSIVYAATAAGAGYASGDILIHSFGIDTALTTPALVYSFWFNAGPSTSGVLASAPAGGTFAQTGQQVSFAAPPTVNLGTLGGAAQDGTDATGVAAPAGGVGIRGWLSGIYAKLSASIGVTGTFWQATQPVSGTFFPATQPVSLVSVPLAAGAALDTSVAAVTAAVNQVKAAIQATVDISGSVWADGTVLPVVYYYRRVSTNEQTGVDTLTWNNPDGTVAAPTVGNLSPISNAQNIVTENLVFTATAAGTGYASGDILIHTFGIDSRIVGGAMLYSIWMNAGPSVASGSILAAAPTGGTFAAVLQAVNIADGGDVTQGSKTDAAYAGGGGSASMVAALKGIYAATIAPLVAGVATIGTVNIGTIGTAAADGTDITGAAMPAGGAGIRGWLSNISKLLTTGVAVTQAGPLIAGNAVIGTVLGPLPAAPIAGQQIMTASAAALPANALQNGVLVTALNTNTGIVYIGAAGVLATTGYPLSPGGSVSLSVANMSGVYVLGSVTTDKIAFVGN